MQMLDLVSKNRSYRRFYQEHEVTEADLRELINLARLTGSGANLQPLKYLLITAAEQKEQVFATLGWAGALKDWHGPEEGEKPAAYIVQLLDREVAKSCHCDDGITAQTILLGAVEKGLGGCMFGNIKRDQLRESLSLSERYDILHVIAIGKPKEDVRIVPVGEDGSTRYYRDADGVHYVPKRELDDLIF